jgi:hypothetical protein
MPYQLNIVRLSDLTDEEKKEQVNPLRYRNSNGDWPQDQKKSEQVLTVELTEEQWKAVKKAVIEAC